MSTEVSSEKVPSNPDETGVKDADNNAVQSEPATLDDEYEYTKRDHEFTSEIYKIELSNLPKNLQFQTIRNLLTRSLGLKAHKVKLGDRRAYVSFDNEQDREQAVSVLNNYPWKGQVLHVSRADPKADPLIKRRKLESSYDTAKQEAVVASENNFTGIDNGDNAERYDDNSYKNETEWTDDDINDKVCNLWRTDYKDQLEIKKNAVGFILIHLAKQIRKLTPNLQRDCPSLFDWWFKTIKENNKMCCYYSGTIASPVVSGYRNKCEFNIGSDGIVGFKCGNYRNGSLRVMRPPKNCPLLNELMFKIIDSFEEYTKSECCSLKPFDQVSHVGNLKQLTVRTNTKEEAMVIVDFHPQSMTADEIRKECDNIRDYLTTNVPQICSIYANVSKKLHMDKSSEDLQLIHGSKYLIEYLESFHLDSSKLDKTERTALDPLKFRVGPTSFFQVNTKAASILYRSIAEIANLSQDTFLLDIACGTGTIGINLSRFVKYVIGIDIVKSAIEDAEFNTKENHIKNAQFFAGKAEDLLSECLTILKSRRSENNHVGEIVAVIDPPRNGLNASLIKTLRGSEIKKIIYVACDARTNRNLIDLCRPQSKAYQNQPFVPKKAIAVDLFPHTEFCELVMLYERLDS